VRVSNGFPFFSPPYTSGFLILLFPSAKCCDPPADNFFVPTIGMTLFFSIAPDKCPASLVHFLFCYTGVPWSERPPAQDLSPWHDKTFFFFFFLPPQCNPFLFVLCWPEHTGNFCFGSAAWFLFTPPPILTDQLG